MCNPSDPGADPSRLQPLRVAHLAVRDMPGSGTGAQLLAAADVDAGHIESAARGLLGNR